MSFDIKAYEWDDSLLSFKGSHKLPVTGDVVFMEHGVNRFVISRHDAIAIAKHFGLIKENYEQQQETMQMLRDSHPVIVSEALFGVAETKDLFDNAAYPPITPDNWYDIPNTEIKQ